MLLVEHYAHEASLFHQLRPHSPSLTRKMQRQHEEVLELASADDDAASRGQMEDALRLVRRFHALAQHNIIEEERDVFPVAARCFEF